MIKLWRNSWLIYWVKSQGPTYTGLYIYITGGCIVWQKRFVCFRCMKIVTAHNTSKYLTLIVVKKKKREREKQTDLELAESLRLFNGLLGHQTYGGWACNSKMLVCWPVGNVGGCCRRETPIIPSLCDFHCCQPVSPSAGHLLLDSVLQDLVDDVLQNVSLMRRVHRSQKNKQTAVCTSFLRAWFAEFSLMSKTERNSENNGKGTDEC